MNCPECGKPLQKQDRPKMTQGLFFCGDCNILVTIEKIHAKQGKLVDMKPTTFAELQKNKDKAH